jgi:hypothetical protein
MKNIQQYLYLLSKSVAIISDNFYMNPNVILNNYVDVETAK